MSLLNIKKSPEELDADMAEIDADGSGDIVSNPTLSMNGLHILMPNAIYMVKGLR